MVASVTSLPQVASIVFMTQDKANPAGFPAGPGGETPFFSERDLVVAVDQLGVFVLG